MVDSRDKGARAESKVRDELKALTGYSWQRVPSSGALNAIHLLKGDLYIPGEYNNYCVEVKHYAEDKLSTKVLTDSTPQLLTWWEQTLREAAQVNKLPLLIFKHDRSKLFCAVNEIWVPMGGLACRYIYIGNPLNIYIFKLNDFIKHCNPEFIRK